MFVCECERCDPDIISTREYNYLMFKLFGEFFQLSELFEFRNSYSIVLKTHVHRIPKRLHIIDQTKTLFLIKEL